MKYDIYISYSSKDSVFVNELCCALDAYRQKMTYYIGFRNEFDTPQEYFDRVSDIIAESKVVLFVASDHSIADGWCKGELNCATNHGVRIYSYYISEAEPLAVPSKTFSANTTSVDEFLGEMLLYIKPENSASKEKEPQPSPESKPRSKKPLYWALVAVVLGFAAWLVYRATPHDPNINMIYVEGGTFLMGSVDVTLDSYYIAETEVTQAQWKAVMGLNPSYRKGNNHPVENVSWDDAMEFCKKLSELTGKKYTLPTEAQWEYAARGGNKSKGYTYSGSNNINDVAWYKYNSYDQLHPVKEKQPNELGLYDMSGNVKEWCLGWFGIYSSSSQTNPTGPESGSHRVLRGGHYYGDAMWCEILYGSASYPFESYPGYGFRVVCIP